VLYGKTSTGACIHSQSSVVTQELSKAPCDKGSMKRTLLALLLLVLLGSTLTACGSSKKAAAKSTSSTTTAGSNFAAEYKAYTDCMAQNGVTLPTNQFQGRGGNGTGTPPNGGTRPTGTAPAGGDTTGSSVPRTRPSTTLPAGVTQAQYDKAQTACASKMPARGNFGGANGANGGANSTQFTAYISCLTDHGVTVTGTGAQALQSVDRTTAAFQAAQTACAPLEPKPTNSSTTSTTA
jgi:hypothetical protein